MKKILFCLLLFALVLSLTACSNTSVDSNSSSLEKDKTESTNIVQEEKNTDYTKY